MDWSIFGSGTDTGTLALGLVLAGVAAGLAAGTLGIGGGLVLVPALYIVLGDFGTAEGARMAVAAGTGLAAMVPAALSVLQYHRQQNQFAWPVFRRTLPWLIGGTLIGGAALCIAPHKVVVIAFGAIALVAAALLFVVKDGRTWLKTPPKNWTLLPLALIGAFTGAGMSAITTPGLLLCETVPQKSAAQGAGFDAVVGLCGAAVAAAIGWGARGLPDHSFGYVNLAAFAVAAPTMFLAATFTAPHSARIDTAKLRKILALFVLLSAGKMLWTALS
jgi:uncharacterized protein